MTLFPDMKAEKGRKVEELILRVEDRLGARLTRAALVDGPTSASDGATGREGSGDGRDERGLRFPRR